MVKGALNMRSVLVLLAITFAVRADTNISYQVGEINKKLTYLQGRLDLFDYITEGNVSVLLHRLEVNDYKYAENITLQMNKCQETVDTKLIAIESKLNALTTTVTNFESKFNVLATTVTNFVAFINETIFKPSHPAPKEGLPWTIVQRRVDASVNFTRKWSEYKRGFGDPEGNFFIGLEKLHELTSQCEPQELWVKLTDPNGITAHAFYDRFAIGSEAENYALKELGKFSGDAGDSLTYHKGGKFSTIDRDNDLKDGMNCAHYFSGAWWYKGCHESHLNGIYGSTLFGEGVNWDSFRGPHVSMRYAHMAIRPIRK